MKEKGLERVASLSRPNPSSAKASRLLNFERNPTASSPGFFFFFITTLMQTTYTYYILTYTVTYNSFKKGSCAITVFLTYKFYVVMLLNYFTYICH